MSLEKTEINNSFSRSHQVKFFNKRIIEDNHFEKLIPSFSILNNSTKNKKNPLFLKTSNLFFSNTSLINNNTNKTNFTRFKLKRLNVKPNLLQIRKIKIKLKKSLSEMFQNNDIDLVRNLNIDSLAQFNNNNQLKENLRNLRKDYFNKIRHKNLNNIIFDSNENYNSDEDNSDLEEQKNKKEKLPILNHNIIKKTFELLQAKKRENKVELNDNVEKETVNKFKILKKEEETKNKKKQELFLRIKEIDVELQDIEDENDFIKDLYLKEISNLSKDINKGIDIFEEVIKFKIKNKFFIKKDKTKKNRQGIIQVINFKKKKENNEKNLDESSIENEKGEKLKPPVSKKLENFEINMKKSSKKKKYDKFKEIQEERANKLLEEKKIIEKETKELDKDIEKNKRIIKEIIDKLMLSYKESLFKGKNVKNEGLVWIIKAIWNLGENVPMSFMPLFLDCESIDYLFKLAKKQNTMDDLTKQISELKMKLKRKVSDKKNYMKMKSPSPINDKNKNNNVLYNRKSLSVKAKLIIRNEKETKIIENEKKKDTYKDLLNQFNNENMLKLELINMPEINMINTLNKNIEKLKKEIYELKKNEINRIYKCFIEKNYEHIYHTNIETVLAALIGLEEKDTEINKYYTIKKNYISSLKKIRFFDHKFIRKIASH